MSRPSIIQIVADDLGYGDLGCFNWGASRTPTLDHLVDSGVCLGQHYAAAPVCAPSRAGLLTGRYPHRTGALDTLDGRGLDRIALRESTLADALRAAGYATGLIGKWHNGSLDPCYHPNRRGFDEFVGFRGGWSDYWDWHLERNTAPMPADGRYLTDVFTDEAVDFVQRHRSDPFYLQLAYTAPHYPMQAPQERIDRYAATGAFGPGVSAVYAMIEAMDEGIARVLETLQTLGLESNTLVTFTSDNGPHFGDHDGVSLTRFNCGFRGAKQSVLEGGIRVPGIVRWPDGLDGGRRIDTMVHFTDWAPTLLSITGADPVGTLAMDGIDVSGVLRGEPDSVDPVRFWQFNRYEPVPRCNAAMRDGDWKLVLPKIIEAMEHHPADLAMDDELRYFPERHTEVKPGPFHERVIPDVPARPQLYNLRSDPLERDDRAADEPQRVAVMTAALGRWFEEVEADRRQTLKPTDASPFETHRA